MARSGSSFQYYLTEVNYLAPVSIKVRVFTILRHYHSAKKKFAVIFQHDPLIAPHMTWQISDLHA